MGRNLDRGLDKRVEKQRQKTTTKPKLVKLNKS